MEIRLTNQNDLDTLHVEVVQSPVSNLQSQFSNPLILSSRKSTNYQLPSLLPLQLKLANRNRIALLHTGFA